MERRQLEDQARKSAARLGRLQRAETDALAAGKFGKATRIARAIADEKAYLHNIEGAMLAGAA